LRGENDLKDENRKTIPWSIKREKCALIVIDMQNDFLKPGGTLYYSDIPMMATPNIKRLLGLCRKLEIPAIYTKTLLKDHFNISPLEAVYQPVLLQKGMREGTWGFEFIDELSPLPDDHIVIKHRYDAFYNTNLELVLNNIRGLGMVDTVIITGTITNVCCESTARSAFMRDYKVVFVSDANGAFDEAAHKATLYTISHFFGRVIDTETLMAALIKGEDNLIPIME
jgi:ureidoacrylate peracid hydrolase